jgi:hypothetical protein
MNDEPTFLLVAASAMVFALAVAAALAIVLSDFIKSIDDEDEE